MATRQWEWAKDNTVQFSLRLSRKSDADVLAALDAAENKIDYVRQLIRKDIAEKSQKAAEGQPTPGE